MAEIAGTVVSAVLRRVRDQGGQATSRANALLLLSVAQRIVNAATDQVYETVTIQTEPKRQIYSTTTLTPNAVSWEDVRERGESL